MPRKAGHADVADKIRSAFKNASARVDLVNLLEKELKARPLDTIRALSTWKPPETHTLEHTGSVEVRNREEQIREARSVIADIGLLAGSAEGNGQDGSVLPDPLPPESTRH